MLEYSPLSLTATGKQRLTADTPLQHAIEKIMVNSYDFDSPLEWAMSHGYSEDDFTEHYQHFCNELLPHLPLADQIRSGHNANLRDDNEPTLERPSGSISVASDGLFDGPNVVTHLPETYVSRLVLSGAAALELMHTYPDVVLDAHGQVTLDTCRFAGAALATCLQREQTGSHIATLDMAQPSFSLASGAETQDVYVGADFHGDFRIALRPRLDGVPVDPDGQPLDFYPSTPRPEYLAAYHSTEPDIMKDVLLHVLLLPDKAQREALIARIINDATTRAGSGQHYLGNFGDAGHGNGREQALKLADALQDTYDHSVQWYGVQPQSPIRLCLTSSPDGITFWQAYGQHDTLASRQGVQLYIPNADIPLFTTALIDQAMRGAGRTSAAAHLRILATAGKLLY